MFRRRSDELKGLEVRVREWLGPVALASDDEHREELSETEQEQRELGIGPWSIGHRRALQITVFYPSA
jgi:hypothetical protein